MTNEKSNIDKFVENATIEALISYVATYRSMKMNRENSIKCMVELDKRRQAGEDIPYEQLIEDEASIIQTIGKGFVVKINPSIDLKEALSNIRKITPAIIFSKDQRLIHVGLPSQEKITTICQLQEADAFEKDKQFLERIANEKTNL